MKKNWERRTLEEPAWERFYAARQAVKRTHQRIQTVISARIAATYADIRLYFGRNGQTLVRYDNERGKGDHRHVGGRELPYRFKTLEALIEDFFADVEGSG